MVTAARSLIGSMCAFDLEAREPSFFAGVDYVPFHKQRGYNATARTLKLPRRQWMQQQQNIAKLSKNKRKHW